LIFRRPFPAACFYFGEDAYCLYFMCKYTAFLDIGDDDSSSVAGGIVVVGGAGLDERVG